MTVSLGPRFQPLLLKNDSSADQIPTTKLTADIFAGNIAPHLSLQDMGALIRCNSEFERFVQKLVECDPTLPDRWAHNSVVLAQDGSTVIPKSLTDLCWPTASSRRIAMTELGRKKAGNAIAASCSGNDLESVNDILNWEKERLQQSPQNSILSFLQLRARSNKLPKAVKESALQSAVLTNRPEIVQRVQQACGDGEIFRPITPPDRQQMACLAARKGLVHTLNQQIADPLFPRPQGTGEALFCAAQEQQGRQIIKRAIGILTANPALRKDVLQGAIRSGDPEWLREVIADLNQNGLWDLPLAQDLIKSAGEIGVIESFLDPILHVPLPGMPTQQDIGRDLWIDGIKSLQGGKATLGARLMGNRVSVRSSALLKRSAQVMLLASAFWSMKTLANIYHTSCEDDFWSWAYDQRYRLGQNLRVFERALSNRFEYEESLRSPNSGYLTHLGYAAERHKYALIAGLCLLPLIHVLGSRALEHGKHLKSYHRDASSIRVISSVGASCAKDLLSLPIVVGKIGVALVKDSSQLASQTTAALSDLSTRAINRWRNMPNSTQVVASCCLLVLAHIILTAQNEWKSS